MKIYTKTGDNGITSLVGGKRISKSDLQLECYGTIDELNSHIGLLMAFLVEEFGQQYPEQDTLNILQRALFTLGGNLACEEESPYKEKLTIDIQIIFQIEQQIDKLNETLPVLKQFTLPQGVKSACQSHVCRTVCRRAERLIVQLETRQTVDHEIFELLNRMSDYFYILSRTIQNMLSEEEVLWKND